MFKFFIGVIFGIILSTIGMQGISKIISDAAPTIDRNVNNLKDSVTFNKE